MTTYTCLACGAPIQPGAGVIVAVDIGGYPDRLPSNVVAHRGCEDRARNMVARELAGKERESAIDATPILPADLAAA